MRNKSILYILLLYIISCGVAQAQVTGTVTDENGYPLPGASVLLKNTTRGATTNSAGYFSITSTPDTFTLIVSFVGSKTKHVETKRNSRLRITLLEEVIEMPEVVIKSGENPAIPIIRKAIEKRKELADIKDHYLTRAYTKGSILSKKSFGALLSLGVVDSMEVRDTAGNIIIYLAETLTEYTKVGNDAKEEILSSRRSGDPKGIAMNFLGLFNVDFNGNYINFQRQLINPIGNSAFLYYNYELEGSYFEGSQKYYKIKVIPKRKEEPVLFGNIYIADDYFTLKQVDLYTRGANLGMELIDTFTIKQTFMKVDGFEKWMPLTQIMAFNAGFMGLKFEGSFLGMYQDYTLLDQSKKIQDKKVVIEFDKLAAKKSEAYWESLRPIKLTEGEALDYQKRDSLAVVYESKTYLDSMDRVSNRFKPLNLLTRYTYKNTYDGLTVSAGNLLTGLRFDAVQGVSIRPDVQFSKWWKESANHLTIFGGPIFGFSEKKLRYKGDAIWSHRGVNDYMIRLSVGNTADNYNTLEPITPFLNELSSLFFKKNYIKFYDNTFAGLSGAYRFTPGFILTGSVKAQHRESLINHTDYSFRLKDESYQFNYPEEWSLDNFYKKSNAYTTSLTFRYQPGNKIIKLPDQSFVLGSDMPVMDLSLINAWAFSADDAHYNRVNLDINSIKIPLGALGTLTSNIHGGFFYGKRPQYELDYAHFPGNLVYVKSTGSYIDAFKRFSYYRFSTPDKYFTMFAEWNLKGFLFKKIPLLNKTGFEEVLAFNAMATPEAGNRIELSAGIDRIGFSVFRGLRFDYIWIFENGKYLTDNFVVGINLDALTALFTRRG